VRSTGQCRDPGLAAYGDVKLWSDDATWPSGAKPVAGDDVIITAGMNVLLDIPPPRLNTLTVTGRLQFYDALDITLVTSRWPLWVLVLVPLAVNEMKMKKMMMMTMPMK
jgi:hypothetical protein